MYRRTFNALSGTPLSGLHKREHRLGQAEALRDARPLRTVAQELGIHIGTAHRWRHRFLAGPQAAMPAASVGIAEWDETMFLLSFKVQRTLPRHARKRGGKAAKHGLSHEQVPVLVARDRAGVTADCVLRATDAATLVKALKPFVPAGLLLCSDGSAALAAAARQLGVEHHAINLSAGIRADGSPLVAESVRYGHSHDLDFIADDRVRICRFDAIEGGHGEVFEHKRDKLFP